MYKYLFIIIAALTVALLITAKSCNSIRADRNRLSNNQTTLLSDAKYWKTEAGKSAASVESLSLTVSEARKSNLGLEKTVEDLNIKLRRVKSTSTTSTATTIEVRTIVRDTVVVRDSIPLLVKTFTWSDAWASVSGVLRRDSVECKIQTADTLTQIVHRVPRKFWFIRWGTKAIEQTVLSSNPHSIITYTRYIELK